MKMTFGQVVSAIFFRLKRFLKNLNIFRKIGYKKYGKKTYICRSKLIQGKKYIELGDNVYIYKGARIECIDRYAKVNLSPSLKIGKDTTIGYDFQCLVADECIIGENCLFASNVLITTENHGIDPTSNFGDQPLDTHPVKIGRNCWIGEKVTILPGVTIGDNVIIGAGSIVTKSIGSNLIVAGNPAKIIKQYDFEKGEWVKIKA